MAEHDLIARHFAPLAGPGSLGLTDDAAVVAPPDAELVFTVDQVIEGMHYLPGDPADMVARKLLRRNLSDLAAMGAAPYGYLLTVAAPRETPETWFAALAQGLAVDQERYGLRLLGGDTASTIGPVVLTATLIGTVARGQALTRSGAKAGDLLFVTGTIGDGAIGLRARRGEIPDPDGALARRYLLPEPRVGLALAGIVHAAIDISDGLLQDCGHICRACGLTAEIDAHLVPGTYDGGLALRLTGGDDYELLLAVPPELEQALRATCGELPVTRIGRLLAGDPVVRVLDSAGRVLRFAQAGWSHF